MLSFKNEMQKAYYAGLRGLEEDAVLPLFDQLPEDLQERIAEEFELWWIERGYDNVEIP